MMPILHGNIFDTENETERLVYEGVFDITLIPVKYPTDVQHISKMMLVFFIFVHIWLNCGLIQVLASCILGAKSLHEAMETYCLFP